MMYIAIVSSVLPLRDSPILSFGVCRPSHSQSLLPYAAAAVSPLVLIVYDWKKSALLSSSSLTYG